MAFLQAEYPRLVGTLSLYCGDAEAAEELAQETLARVCRDWDKVRRMNAPGAWAHKVAMNLASSHFRRRAATKKVLEKLSSRAATSMTDPDAGEAVEVRRAVANLPRRERQVLIMRHYVGLSVEEVAEATGFPEGTVKTLTRRALAKLRNSDHLVAQEVSDV